MLIFSNLMTHPIIGYSKESDHIDFSSSLRDFKGGEIYSEHKLGYWNRKNKLILEGYVGIGGIQFNTNDSVEKYVELVDELGNIRSQTKAITTNWYDPLNYNGYQVQLGIEELEGLESGDYLIQLKIIYDGKVYTVPMKEQVFFFYPEISAAQVQNIEGSTLEKTVIDLRSIANRCFLTIHEVQEGTNRLFDYTGKKGVKVYDGWINSRYDFNRPHTKKIVIEDLTGLKVYQKEGITWDINANFQLGVVDSLVNSGFQVEIPKKYQGLQYQKFIQINEQNKEQEKYELDGK